MMGAIDTAERPVVLVWEVTQACELACEHCRADAQPERHPEELSTAEGKALLREAARFGDDQLVVLSGGDPLIREDLPELVSYGVDRGLQMTLTPSGTTRLTPGSIAELADAGLRRMALSIDGATADSHDEFRGEECFADTLAAARAADDAGIPVQINTTVCESTAGDLPGIRRLVADLDAVLWSVFFLVPVGRGTALDPVAPARAERIASWLCEVRESEPFGVKTTEAPFFRRVAAQRGEGGPGGRRPGITAGDGFAFVSHVGDVYPSGFLPESAGNVREESVVDVYRDSELFSSLRDPDALSGKCGACEYRGLCGGSRSRAYACTGDPLASDPLCAYVPDGYEGPLPRQEVGQP